MKKNWWIKETDAAEEAKNQVSEPVAPSTQGPATASVASLTQDAAPEYAEASGSGAAPESGKAPESGAAPESGQAPTRDLGHLGGLGLAKSARIPRVHSHLADGRRLYPLFLNAKTLLFSCALGLLALILGYGMISLWEDALGLALLLLVAELVLVAYFIGLFLCIHSLGEEEAQIFTYHRKIYAVITEPGAYLLPFGVQPLRIHLPLNAHEQNLLEGAAERAAAPNPIPCDSLTRRATRALEKRDRQGIICLKRRFYRSAPIQVGEGLCELFLVWQIFDPQPLAENVDDFPSFLANILELACFKADCLATKGDQVSTGGQASRADKASGGDQASRADKVSRGGHTSADVSSLLPSDLAGTLKEALQPELQALGIELLSLHVMRASSRQDL